MSKWWLHSLDIMSFPLTRKVQEVSTIYIEHFPGGQLRLKCQENPSLNKVGYFLIFNLIRVHFLDFFDYACSYWLDLTIIQANELGLS